MTTPCGQVLSVNTGRPADLPYRGGTVRTAFVKEPRQGDVDVDADGLAGDEQGDQVRHGGPDKALLAYAVEHYDHWREIVDERLPRPWFGENLTVSALPETVACIGDVLRIGSVVAEVAQARQPCFKLAARHGIREMAKLVQDTGFTGYYLRVLEPGAIAAGAVIERLDRPNPNLSVAELNRLLYRDRRDADGIRRALAAPQLARATRELLERRLRGIEESFDERLYGSADVLDGPAEPAG